MFMIINKESYHAQLFCIGDTENNIVSSTVLQLKNWPPDFGNIPAVSKTISVAEVRAIVKGLKSNNAVGNNDNSGKLYEYASQSLIRVLALFLCGSIRTKQLPEIKCM